MIVNLFTERNVDMHTDSATFQQAMRDIEKAFGKGTCQLASSLKPREYRSTGSIALDVALGGGWGKSTIVDLLGKHAAGKTLLFEMAAVTAQTREGLPSCLFDFEGTFDPKRFTALGGDPTQLYLVRAENFADDTNMFIEWAADMMKLQLRNRMFACIGLDSTAAMVSKAEFEIKEAKGEEASTMAYTARAMSSILRQLVGTGLVSRSGATLFFMSQMRDNIGGRSFRGIPPADNRTGGRALPFYAATQLEVSRGEVWKSDIQQESGLLEEDAEVGHETKVRVRKNKNNAKQNRVASFDLYVDGEVVGIDSFKELAKLAVACGIIKKAGSWRELPDGRKIQGDDALRDILAQDAALAAILDLQTRNRLELALAVAKPGVLVGYDPEFDADEARQAVQAADDEDENYDGIPDLQP